MKSNVKQKVHVLNDGRLKAPFIINYDRELTSNLPYSTEIKGKLTFNGPPHEFIPPNEEKLHKLDKKSYSLKSFILSQRDISPSQSLIKSKNVYSKTTQFLSKFTKFNLIKQRNANSSFEDPQNDSNKNLGFKVTKQILLKRACWLTAMLLILAASLTMSVRLSTALAREVDTLFFSSAIRIPPPGVYISQMRIVPFLSAQGTPIFLITGLVKNDTEDNFSGVTIEGLTYDPEGAIIGRSVASAGVATAGVVASAGGNSISDDLPNTPPDNLSNDLSNSLVNYNARSGAEIKTLTQDAIFSLKKNTTAPIKLPHGQSIPFSLMVEPISAISNEKIIPSSYSARVFTVEK